MIGAWNRQLRSVLHCWGLFLIVACVVQAQETIQSVAGQLQLTVTDLSLQAGSVTLKVRRSWQPGRQGAALGLNWFLHEDTENPLLNWQHDDQGRVIRIAGPRGRAFDLIWNSGGQVGEIRSSTGQRVTYTYKQGRLTTVSVNGGPVTRYNYDAAGRLVRIERPVTGAVTLTYDVQSRVLSRGWADGAREFYEYQDGPAPLVRHIDAAGGATTVQRYPEDHRVVVTDVDGNITTTVHNDQGLPLKVIHPGGGQALMAYDEAGRLLQVRGPDGRVVQYTYDGDTRRIASMAQGDESPLVYAYDRAGRLVSLKRDGRVMLSLTYTANGQVKTREGVGCPRESLSYTSNGLLQARTDALGHVTTYAYDAQDRLIGITDAAGGSTTWTYDKQGRVIRRTDPGQAVTRFDYDDQGRLQGWTDPAGGHTGLTYDEVGRPVTRTDPLGRVTRMGYNAGGQLTSFKNPAGHETRYEYDQAGRLIRWIDPLGGVTRYRYDNLGRVSGQTDSAGRTWTCQYAADSLTATITGPDGCSRVLQDDPVTHTRRIQDGTGLTQTLQVDSEGRPLKLAVGDQGSVELHYDPQGQVVRLEGTGQAPIDLAYDALGRVSEERSATGLTISYRYDALSRLVGRQDNLGGRQGFRYNARGLVGEQVDALGGLWQYEHDAAGRLKRLTDPRGGATNYVYNAAGELLEIQGPNRNSTSLTCDQAGYLAAVRHPDGGVTQVARDALGRALTVTDAQGQSVRRAYDQAGRLVREINARGQQISYQYDAAGRLSQKRLPEAVTVTYRYDDQGRLTQVDDGRFPVQLAYDAAGRVTRRQYPAIKWTLTYRYDRLGRLERQSDSSGREVRYEYDRFGRLTGLEGLRKEGLFLGVSLVDHKIHLDYDARDRLIGVVHPNGIRAEWRYDALGRAQGIQYRNAEGKVLLNRSVTYDSAGNPTRITEETDQSTAYAYDVMGQLIGEQGPAGDIRYNYSPGGNRQAVVRGDQTRTYQYGPADRLLQAGDEKLTYDADGNVVERSGPDGATRYQYNSENRLIAAIQPDGRKTTFGYGPLGERIWREDGQGRTWFVTDGANLIAELNADLETRTTYLHGPGLDRPLQIAQGKETFTALVDHLGSVLALTDPQGRIVAAYRSDAFGNPVGEERGPANPLRFTARYYESQLGLYYYRARFYDPQLGRFLSKDPYRAIPELPMNLHLYAYVQNVPTRFRDPLGLIEEAAINGQLTRYGITEQEFTDRLVLPEARYQQRMDRYLGISSPWSENVATAKGYLYHRMSAGGGDDVRGQAAVTTLRQAMANQLGSLRKQMRDYPDPYARSDMDDSLVEWKPPGRLSVSQETPDLGVTRPGTPPPGAGPAPTPQGAQTVRVNRVDDPTVRVNDAAPDSSGTAPVRSAVQLNGGWSSVQKPGFAEINRPLTTRESIGKGTLGVLSAVELGNRIYHSDNPAEEVKSAGVSLAVGTAVTVGGTALIGAGPMLVVGLTASIASHADDVAELPGEVAAWQEARSEEAAAEQRHEQFLGKIGDAVKTLETTEQTIRAEMDPLVSRGRTLCQEAQKSAQTAQQAGEAASSALGSTQLPPLQAFAEALEGCESLNDKQTRLKAASQGSDQADALKREIQQIQNRANRLHTQLTQALKARDETARQANVAVKSQTALQNQSVAYQQIRTQVEEKAARWRGQIEKLQASFKEAKPGADKQAFEAKARHLLALLNELQVSCELEAWQKQLQAGVESAVNAKLTAQNRVTIDYEVYADQLSECADTRTFFPETVSVAGDADAVADPNAAPSSGWGDDSLGEALDPSMAGYAANNPNPLAEGFGDDSDGEAASSDWADDSVGEGLDQGAAGTVGNSAPAGGFSDESDEAGEEAPYQETVTYFDRPWLPRSWATSLDSRAVRINIYEAGSRLGWAASLARYTWGQADATIGDHLQTATNHIKTVHDQTLAPRKAWPKWKEYEKKHNSWVRRLQQKKGDDLASFRSNLGKSIRAHALALADLLAYQGDGKRWVKMENCDSYAMRIGFHLAFASQTFSYAAEAEAHQVPAKVVRGMKSEAATSLQTALRMMRGLDDLKLASGSCVDLDDIAATLHRDSSGGKSLAQQATAAQQAWQAVLAALGQQGSPGQKEVLDIEKVGQYVFSNIKQYWPSGVPLPKPRAYKDLKENKMSFDYFKGRAMNHVYSDGRTYLDQYGGAISIDLRYRIPLEGVMHDWGKGSYFTKTERRGGEAIWGGDLKWATKKKIGGGWEKYTLWICWKYGDWILDMEITDTYDSPDTMFHSLDGMYNYAVNVIKELSPRIKNIPNINPYTMVPLKSEGE